MRGRFYFLIALLISLHFYGVCQSIPNSKPPKDWFLKDPDADQLLGLSVERAYHSLLKDKPAKTVIVAVVDTGVDIDHEDLKNVIWVNEDEIPDNGVDDDKNGYVDDVNGWNFIGGKNGNINEDTYEITREYARLRRKFENNSQPEVNAGKKSNEEYKRYQEYKRKWQEKREEDFTQYQLIKQIYENLIFSLDTLKKFLKSDTISEAQLQSITSSDPTILFAKGYLIKFFTNLEEDTFQEKFEELKDAYETSKSAYELSADPDFEPRTIVGDNYSDPTEKYYGNNYVKPMSGPVADHGTHVAGIIAASRDNNLGIKGIADHVKIMVIRAVPNGDERDKDIANAIYYAVNNGARIINLSCGKNESPQKDVVDKAVQYAELKGVLIVHAAGNESVDNDKVMNYPTAIYKNGGEAKNWISVGASGWGGNNFIGSFSNYGKKSVDVFAPGVAIYSTVPGQRYKNYDGTSMACPAVAGVAAMLMAYFPEFSSTEIKNIILESVRTFENKVQIPGTKTIGEFEQLSKTGGIVNAYEAVQLALKKRGEK